VGKVKVSAGFGSELGRVKGMGGRVAERWEREERGGTGVGKNGRRGDSTQNGRRGEVVVGIG
jgi:hypothetical protein